ncbi:MAG: hypothetical protein KC503_42270 [Myxococcales bacterium]|nr:hypothetical protein [Myxococcales bacterium]
MSLVGCGAVGDEQSPRGYEAPRGASTPGGVSSPASRETKGGSAAAQAVSPSTPVGNVPGSSRAQSVRDSVALPAPAPTEVAGDPSCAGLGLGSFEVVVSPLTSGQYNFDPGSLDVMVSSSGASIELLAQMPTQAIIVKGTTAANVYQLDGSAQHLSGLAAPGAAMPAPASSRLTICVP